MAYSDKQRESALTALALNKNDYDTTAKQTGISKRTLAQWVADAKNCNKKSVPETLEATLIALLERIPKRMSGKDWGIALGILMDKWLLAQGEPTSRAESIVRGLGGLPDSQRTAILDAAEQILTEAIGGGVADKEPNHDA